MKNQVEGRSKLVDKLFLIPLVIYLSLNLFKPSFPSLEPNFDYLSACVYSPKPKLLYS